MQIIPCEIFKARWETNTHKICQFMYPWPVAVKAVVSMATAYRQHPLKHKCLWSDHALVHG